MINKKLSTEDMYPDPASMKDLINFKDFLDECKNFYGKDELANISVKEIHRFIMYKATQMANEEQDKIIKQERKEYDFLKSAMSSKHK